MISLETIEELETKIMKALELISDLRAENNRLESDNEALRSENDQMKLAMEEKEREIASLREQLAQSLKELEEYTSKEIGDMLFISPLTVDTHRKHLIEKLEVKSSIGLIRYALLFNLI